MPISKSAKKSYRASERKRARNLTAKNKLKGALKKINSSNSNETISLIDKSAKNHLISKNKASRLKSRLMKKMGTNEKKKLAKGNKKTVKKMEK